MLWARPYRVHVDSRALACHVLQSHSTQPTLKHETVRSPRLAPLLFRLFRHGGCCPLQRRRPQPRSRGSAPRTPRFAGVRRLQSTCG